MSSVRLTEESMVTARNHEIPSSRPDYPERTVNMITVGFNIGVTQKPCSFNWYRK